MWPRPQYGEGERPPRTLQNQTNELFRSCTLCGPEGGSPLSVVTDPATVETSFSVSIDNASDTAIYGVYAAEAVTGPYVRVANPGVDRDGSVRTFTITVPDGEDAQFVVILAAESEAFLPAQFDDPSQFR